MRWCLGRRRPRDLRELEEGENADLDDHSPVNYIQHLWRPVLLAHGTSDRRVPFEQYEQFERFKDDARVEPEFLMIQGSGHSFAEPRREQAWYDALVGFLAEHNPAD